jgi:hypothetical protein
MNSVEEWNIAKKIELPWTGEKTQYTIQSLDCQCGKCGKMMKEFRGDIYESFETVEVRGAGVCHDCRLIIPIRCRVYPKTGIFMRMMNGAWKSYRTMTAREICMKWIKRNVKTTIWVYLVSMFGWYCLGVPRVCIEGMTFLTFVCLCFSTMIRYSIYVNEERKDERI